MVLIPSAMLPLGTPAPDFTLPGGTELLSRDRCRGPRGLLVMFICNHCPYVQHIEEGLLQLGRDYRDSGIGIVAISANDADQFPEDGPEKMAERAASKSYPFPSLYDESQQTARAYHAECTPDFFLFDADLRCVYRGCFDASRPNGDTPVTGENLRTAMDGMLKGEAPQSEQIPSMGCNIKWKDPR